MAVAILRKELGITGTIPEVVKEAATLLGLPNRSNLTLIEQANACCEMIQGSSKVVMGEVISVEPVVPAVEEKPKIDIPPPAPRAPPANQVINREIFDKSRYPNGGPRGDQNVCCVSLCCAHNFIMCPLHCISMWGFDKTVHTLTSMPCKYIPCSPCDPSGKMPLWFCSEPLGWAASHGQLHTVMSLVEHGANPYTMNGSGNNAFTDAERERHTHVTRWLNEWKAQSGAGGARLISTEEIAGCWGCMCIPGGWAVFKKEAQGENTLKHGGVVFLFGVIPVPFEEYRERHPGTNGFYKQGEPGNIDQHCSSRFVCNGLSCSCKPC